MMEAKLGMVPYTCHPSIWEFRGLQVQRGYPELHSKFKVSLNCIARPCLKQKAKERAGSVAQLVACLPRTKPRVPPPQHCNAKKAVQEAELGESKVQSHPCLYRISKASQGYRKPCFKK